MDELSWWHYALALVLALASSRTVRYIFRYVLARLVFDAIRHSRLMR